MHTAVAPIDDTETVPAQEGIEQTDRSTALASVAKIGRNRIAARQHVSDGERVLPIDPHGERDITPDDVVVPGSIAGTDVADEVLARGRIERSSVAKNQAQRNQPLRGKAVVIVVLRRGVDGSDRCVAGTRKDAALKRDRSR